LGSVCHFCDRRFSTFEPGKKKFAAELQLHSDQGFQYTTHAYEDSGKLTGSRIIETVTGVTEIPLTVTGSSIRFFFLRSGSFLPLVACVELQKSQ